MSVRSKVTAAFAMCISLPLMAGMGALWLGTESILRNSAGDELQASTQSAMSGIEDRLEQNLTHLQAWSSLPVMQDVLIGDDGKELSRTLSELNLHYPEFSSLVITNAQGEVIATTDAAERGANLNGNEGVHAAISGRIYQSKLSAHREGGAQTIWFTVPLIANYDRQTVIGTLTGVLDLRVVARNVMVNSPLGLEGRMLVLTDKSTGLIIFSPHDNGPLFDSLKSLELKHPTNVREVFLSGQPYLVTSAASKLHGAIADVGFSTYGVAPSVTVFAAVDNVSNIFLVVASLAGAVALVIAWRWSTPLVRLSAIMNRLAHGDPLVTTPALPSHHTFAPMAHAVDTLREVRFTRDRLAAREQELIRAKDEAETRAAARDLEIEELGRTLKDQINDILELSDLINKENLVAASNKRHASYARELSATGAKLMNVIEAVLVRAHSSNSLAMEPPQRMIA